MEAEEEEEAAASSGGGEAAGAAERAGEPDDEGTEEPPPPPPPPASVAVGGRVELRDLVSAAKYNGKHGTGEHEASLPPGYLDGTRRSLA